MDLAGELRCKYCHEAVTPEDYFCPHCGKKLKDKPPATTVQGQIKVYLITVLLWPFGLIYVWRYLRQPEAKAKKIGWTVLVVWYTKSLIDSVREQFNAAYGGLL
jgi:hypothetical protein